ncbi:MAG TPA: ABC transporter permease subunit [Methylomirabilota bacterium]|jgi:putative spermidine/putrescine transport system permease protein|nr:ABC transporter permease subunit [Methylomirabilota bacterium]
MSGDSPARRTLGGLTARLVALVLAAFVIVGPLLSLLLWSLAERWTYPAAWPQRLGLRYWSRMLTGDFLDPLRMSLLIATIVTVAALVCAVPLGYALARLRFPGRTLVLLAFLLPQAFPQLPVFAAATREFYRWGLAGTVSGVVLVHLVGGLVFAVWTMTAVFRSIEASLEEAAYDLGASTTRAFLTVSLPLAVPGLVASALLVFLYSLDEFTGTLLVGAPFVTTLPVYMYTASQGYEMQIASVTALVLMVPGAVLLLLLERFLRSEYLTFFGQI